MKNDPRKHTRLEVELPLTWTIESQNLSGMGKLLDVSAPGACFRMDQPFAAKAGLAFTLDAPDVPAMPRRGRLRWYRKLPGRVPVFLCGVMFEDPENDAWNEWLDRALATPDASFRPAFERLNP
jgi:hypothetical protein